MSKLGNFYGINKIMVDKLHGSFISSIYRFSQQYSIALLDKNENQKIILIMCQFLLQNQVWLRLCNNIGNALSEIIDHDVEIIVMLL
jgi:hypothetical protein